MELFKYVFFIIAGITLFNLFGGLEPGIGFGEMALKAVFVGLIFATGLVLKEAKEAFLNKIS